MKWELLESAAQPSIFPQAVSDKSPEYGNFFVRATVFLID